METLSSHSHSPKSLHLFLTWSEEIQNMVVKLERQAVYVLDQSILGTGLPQAIAECSTSRSSYLVVDNLNKVDTLFGLVSLLREHVDIFVDVVNLDERTQFAAAVIQREVFGNVRAADCLLATRDKREMKNRLRTHVDMARHFSVASHIRHGAMATLPDDFNFPLIVKPVNRYGSTGIHRISDMQELNEFISANADNLAQFICEEVVEGDEYNVDAIWVNGKIEYLFVGQYIVPRLYGYEHRIPKRTIYLPYRDHQALYRRVRVACERAAQALGLHDGVTHAEFFIDGDTLVLGEIASRQAGGGMSPAIRAATGESLVELGMRARLGCMAGAPANRTITGNYVGFIDLRPASSGTARDVIPQEELQRYPGVVELIYRVRMNHYIEAYGRDSWCVLAIVEAPDRPTLDARMDALQAAFWCRCDAERLHRRAGPQAL